MRTAQLVIGPAGSGKSTYCKYLQEHCATTGRSCKVVNLDPAAEAFNYECAVDVKELIKTNEVMDYFELGPNGALMFAMEYLLKKTEWIEEIFDDSFHDDDYVLIDCPGQIELYTHSELMFKFLRVLQNLNFDVIAVYCLDVSFTLDPTKFLSGTMSALSAMVMLEIQYITLLTKVDLLNSSQKEEMLQLIDKAPSEICHDLAHSFPPKYLQLTNALSQLLDDWSMVSFATFDISDEESMANVLLQCDMITGYDDKRECRDFDMPAVEMD